MKREDSSPVLFLMGQSLGGQDYTPESSKGLYKRRQTQPVPFKRCLQKKPFDCKTLAKIC